MAGAAGGGYDAPATFSIMRPVLVVLLAAALPVVAACSKWDAKKASAKTQPGAPDEAAPPRRNMGESLGFAAESAEGYTRPESDAPKSADTAPPPAAPEQAVSHEAAPAPVQTQPAAAKPGLRRTLTATDGRTVEAELLAKSDAEVKIRRAADSREFTIPLDRISEADRNFVRESELPPLAAR